MTRPPVPRATYRLQLTAELDFDAAAGVVGYLAELGISDVYASPILTARPGSSHGYDVADPTHLSPVLGGDDGFARLTAARAAAGLGLLLDIVPNHMAADPSNPWWADVLRHGPASEHADFFDLDWAPASGPVSGRVLLPVLGRPYHQALAAGELVPELNADGFAVRYFERAFPLDPATWPAVLEPVVAALDPQDEAAVTVSRLAGELGRLPPRRPDAAARSERRRWYLERWPRLREVLEVNPAAAAVETELRRLGGRPHRPPSFDRLHHLLDRQAFRLAYWRSAREKLNYRRFFNISDLVGLRTERPEVFAAVHSRVLELVAAGAVTGLRVDHVDGLRDPFAYLQRLYREAGSAGRDLYLVVEKILAPEEELPPAWPVHGTTGYDFLAAVNALLVDPTGLAELARVVERVGGDAKPFAERAYRARRRIVRDLFPGELRVLEHRLADLAERDRWACDIPRRELNRAFEEVTACLAVYRTYARGAPVDEHDRTQVERALREAQRRVPTLAVQALRFLRRLLLLELPPDLAEEQLTAWTEFVLRWQQVTGPVAAKGVEDTAFYQESRLVSLAEVGGDPGSGALSPAAFHRLVASRSARWPHSMNATSTHDTKRGEDARARLAVLSELSEEWARRVERWRDLNQAHRTLLASGPAPDPTAELVLYQTLLATWPGSHGDLARLGDRVAAFMTKAAREAKERSSWLRPDETYERAVTRFVAAILADPDSTFVTELDRFAEAVAFYGFLNSLSQLTLKLTVPGVPDLYQGAELWDLALVDPDNRRPVDFAFRRALLAELADRNAEDPTLVVAELLAGWRDGRVKLWLTRRLLELRRRLPELLRDGDYRPVETAGPAARHLVAFTRHHEGSWLLVVVPRLLVRMTAVGEPPLGERVWRGTTVVLPADAPTAWRSALTARASRSPQVGELLEHAPVAVLTARHPRRDDG